MQRYLLLVLVFFSGAVNAALVIIDFEVPPANDIGLSGYSEDGFTVTPNSATGTVIDSSTFIHSFFGGAGNGSNSMLWGTEGISMLTLTENGGAAFSLGQFDAASVGEFGGIADFTVVGNKLGGGQVIEVVSLGLDLTTVSLIQDFTGLLSVEFYYDQTVFNAPFEIDNIAVSTVPIPAAVWLFGSALAGLGWIRRKQTA